MTRPVFVLSAAKEDYREIRAYVRKNFGNTVWQEVDAEYKKVLSHLGEMPEAGSIPEEIVTLGLTDCRQRLVRQTRVVYQIKDEGIYVHMFVDTNRDFQTMLYKRLMKLV